MAACRWVGAVLAAKEKLSELDPDPEEGGARVSQGWALEAVQAQLGWFAVTDRVPLPAAYEADCDDGDKEIEQARAA